MYWDGISTIIRDGESIKGKKHIYTIEKLINDGASIVYKAKRDDGKEIFLKQFKDPTARDDEWEEFIKFQHSVLRTLLQLPSDKVELNYEYFEQNGVHFHAKGFEDGVDLAKLIWEEKPNINVRLTLALNMLETLSSVHKKGLIHSDLKPQQFFVIKDKSKKIGYRVKLIDFDHCIIPALNLYSPASTPGWASPEHVQNKKVDFASDSFTMGQIIYTLISGGKQPYGHSLDSDSYEKDIFTKKGYISINDLFKGKLPQEISDLLDTMMDPDPSKRPTLSVAYEKYHKAINPEPKPAPTPKPAPSAKVLTLESNGRSRLIVQTQIITRELVKSSFGNHGEIYNKQFEIMKDNSGTWFVKGLNVPGEAKDAKGKVYKFYKTLHNGVDITNKYTKLVNTDTIEVGSTKFSVKL